MCLEIVFIKNKMMIVQLFERESRKKHFFKCVKYFSKILNNPQLFWRNKCWCKINFKEGNTLYTNNCNPLPFVQLGNLTWYLASNLLFQSEWAMSWIDRRRLWVLPLKWRAFGSSRSCPPICLSSCNTSCKDMPQSKSKLPKCITSADSHRCFLTLLPPALWTLHNERILQPQYPPAEAPASLYVTGSYGPSTMLPQSTSLCCEASSVQPAFLDRQVVYLVKYRKIIIGTPNGEKKNR